MTLIIAVHNHKTIWMAADRRLSTANKKVVTDEACKLFHYKQAIFGYAGLGATSRHKTEPSEWMKEVLKGRNDQQISLLNSLILLTNAMNQEFKKHMVGIENHVTLINAIDENQIKLYGIEYVNAISGRTLNLKWYRKKIGKSFWPPCRVNAIGSGVNYLSRLNIKLDRLIYLLRACDREKVNRLTVADELANINYQISTGAEVLFNDISIGPKCMVSWINKNNCKGREGGATQFYDGVARVKHDRGIPLVIGGLDGVEMASELMKLTAEHMNTLRKDPTAKMDQDKLQELFNRLRKPPNINLK